jgi:hypothetical protein
VKNQLIVYYSTAVTLGLLVLLALLGKGCKDAAYAEQMNKQNIAALTDTLSEVKLRNGQLQYQKAILFTDKETLEKLNADLKKELDKVKGGKPEVIIKTDVQYVGATLNLSNDLTVLEDGSLGLKFGYKTESRLLEGVSSFRVTQTPNEKEVPGKVEILPGFTKIFKDEVRFGLTVGIKKESDGTRNIFVIPSDTSLKIVNIIGANLDKEPIPKKKHFGFGPSIQITYDFINQRPVVGVGLGLQYNIIKF